MSHTCIDERVYTRQLRVEIVEPWHAGSGRGRGRHLDALVVRDGEGLPYLPGKHLKGLLRDALECLDEWRHTDRPRASALCGNGAGSPDPEGRLKVSNAVIADNERAWLAAHRTGGAIDALFIPSFHTAIEPDAGVALAKSLRGLEVVVPMIVTAELELEGGDPQDWRAIAQALGLVRAVGAWRTRGLGRAQLALEPEVAA